MVIVLIGTNQYSSCLLSHPITSSGVILLFCTFWGSRIQPISLWSPWVGWSLQSSVICLVYDLRFSFSFLFLCNILLFHLFLVFLFCLFLGLHLVVFALHRSRGLCWCSLSFLILCLILVLFLITIDYDTVPHVVYSLGHGVWGVPHSLFPCSPCSRLVYFLGHCR